MLNNLKFCKRYFYNVLNMTTKINSNFEKYTSVYLKTEIKCCDRKNKINQLSYFLWVYIDPNPDIHVFVSERITILIDFLNIFFRQNY